VKRELLKRPFHLTGYDASGRRVNSRYATAEKAMAKARTMPISVLPLPYIVTFDQMEAALGETRQ
jgi:hypothetical protein